MKFNKPNDEEPSLNLAPLIDVVFLLLIFFMVTTSFVKDNVIDLSLPEASSRQNQQQEFYLTITVSKLDEIIVENDQERFSKVSGASGRKTLGENIRQSVERIRAEKPALANTAPTVIIDADRAASHGRVVELMDVLAQLGISKIQFGVQPVSSSSQ